MRKKATEELEMVYTITEKGRQYLRDAERAQAEKKRKVCPAKNCMRPDAACVQCPVVEKP